MTDRRTTISLNWRPSGAPARRHDDFAEVPYAKPQPRRRQDTARPDTSDIDQRLQNWGRWANAEHRRINRTATAAFCDRLRREAGLHQDHSDERRRLDDDDAYLIERALDPLRGTQKAILRMHYVDGRVWQAILRVLQFPVKRELFDSLLVNAQVAIESVVEKHTEKQ